MSLKRGVRSALARSLLSYGPERLLGFLHRNGIAAGATLMVHSSWRPDNGFRSSPADFVRVLQEAVGSDGLLVMPSMTYHDQSTSRFLESGKPVDIRRSASRMGVLSEVFRRSPGVHRSRSAAHPLVAWGADAERFLGDHHLTMFSFGPGSPFERLLERDAKILLVDAPFSTITFTHYLEHRLLGERLYEPEARVGTVVDQDGTAIRIPTRVIAAEIHSARREERLVKALDEAGAIRRARLGRTRFMVLDCRAMNDQVDRMIRTGVTFFDLPAPIH